MAGITNGVDASLNADCSSLKGGAAAHGIVKKRAKTTSACTAVLDIDVCSWGGHLALRGDWTRMLMRGGVGAGPKHMADYIARDPRTGKPIEVATVVQRARVEEGRRGAWSRLTPAQVLDLATGRTDVLNLMLDGERRSFTRLDGVEGLVLAKGVHANAAYDALIEACMDDDAKIRRAALMAMPEVAQQRSDEVFDHLSVLIDDPEDSVRAAACDALRRMTPVFPSGVEDSLVNALRSTDSRLSKAAWEGLRVMGDSWPSVVCVHVDSLLLEDAVHLRKEAARLLGRVVARAGHQGWDLVTWALADEEVVVRREAAKCLPKLVNPAPKMAVLLAEKVLYDPDATVRGRALKVLERVDLGGSRARSIVLAGTRHAIVDVRRACVEMLHRFMGEDEQRSFAQDRLQAEKDPGIRALLMEMIFDPEIDGSEDQKNRFLAPAEPVPLLDREVAQAMEQPIGMLEPERTEAPPVGPDAPEPPNDEGQQR